MKNFNIVNNINTFSIISIALIAALAVFSCGAGDDDGGKSLGAVQIVVFGQPVSATNPATTGDTLYADYDGLEDVSYQWKRDGANVGEDWYSLVAEDPGSYTVTVSFPGYPSRTSAAVTVGGQSLSPLPGTLTITVNGVAVTTAQTGDELVAVYSNDNVNTVAYQWFKDGVGLTTYSDPDDTSCVPAEKGSYTVKITADGYRATTSDPVTVTGPTLITIVFDLNGAGYDHPEKLAVPGAPIGTLPDAPPQNGLTFVGWYSEPVDGDEITAATVFDEATTVYAHWSFSGGTPYIDAETNTLVHPNPLMEKGQQFAGSISEADGTISYTAGAFQYKFPTSVDGAAVNINDYAYYTIEYELKSATGNVSGVRLRQYNNTTDYVGASNVWPWLSNAASIQLPVSGAGTTGGFSMLYNGGSTTIEVKITKITFYKLPAYTVTFDLNGGAGTVPTSVMVYEGDTLGAQFPATIPTKEDNTFVGWKNAAGAVVTGTTPIMGSWTLTAQWVLTAELGDEWIELITTTATSAPVYVFDIDEDTLADYTRIIVKIKSDAAVSGRLRAWGVYNLTTWTSVGSRPNMGNAAGDKLLTDPGLDGFSHNGTWAEYELPLNAITATNQGGATGLLAIALGLIAPSGQAGQRNYYIKDIVLANADKTKSVPALRPDDDQLWGGAGASAYVTQNGADVVTRMILPYE